MSEVISLSGREDPFDGWPTSDLERSLIDACKRRGRLKIELGMEERFIADLTKELERREAKETA